MAGNRRPASCNTPDESVFQPGLASWPSGQRGHDVVHAADAGDPPAQITLQAAPEQLDVQHLTASEVGDTFRQVARAQAGGQVDDGAFRRGDRPSVEAGDVGGSETSADMDPTDREPRDGRAVRDDHLGGPRCNAGKGPAHSSRGVGQRRDRTRLPQRGALTLLGRERGAGERKDLGSHRPEEAGPAPAGDHLRRRPELDQLAPADEALLGYGTFNQLYVNSSHVGHCPAGV